ncbi:MAG: class III signal peptide-containing protein [Candidatus Marsarchaeota archaeon]|nr:class III signal peptide-containing protein [Candidatus Marsarchaeota archaeon]
MIKNKGQTAIEYLLLIAAAVVFVTVVAYFIKTSVLK